MSGRISTQRRKDAESGNAQLSNHQLTAADVKKLRDELNRHHEELQTLRRMVAGDDSGNDHRPDDDDAKAALWDAILEAEFWAMRSGALAEHFPLKGGAA